MYWDINKCLSYNCLFNFIVGARGVGKTYGAKDWAIRDFLKTGSQFVYVRRFDKELKKCNKFFDDIMLKYANHEFRFKDKTFQIDGKVAGTPIALSTAKIEKSTPFPKVNKIIFDEFILDRGYHHYLPDEVTNFLELYSTVARDRDVRVLFLSNALTVTNPYFLYFDITLPYEKSISAKNDILIELCQNEEYKEHMEETRFGKLIKGTSYADYAVNNKFFRDKMDFVEKKTGTSKCIFALKYNEQIIGIWHDYESALSYVSYDVDPFCKLQFSVTLQDHSPNYVLLKGNRNFIVQRFIEDYKQGMVRFENINLSNITKEIIKMSL